MGRTFCIDNPLSQGVGFFDCTGVNTDEIIDTIGNVDQHVRNKMGSSIPTIFARMFLFNSAYIDVTKRDEKQQGAHNGKLGKDGSITPDVYNCLISEHLDTLEFIFRKGADRKMRVILWTVSELDKLNEPQWNNFVDAVKTALGNTPRLKDLEQIALFEYDGHIVGGTSPVALVFTNPNWEDIVSQNGYDFSGLFKSVHKALHERDLDFRKLLYLQCKRGDFNQDPDFRKYIEQSFDNYDQALREAWGELVKAHQDVPVEDWVDDEIAKIAYTLTDTSLLDVLTPVTNIHLYCKKKDAANPTQSDYIIQPSTDETLWKKENVNGEDRELRVAPYILVPNGIPAANYFNGQRWSNKIHFPDYSEIKNDALSERTLPGVEQKIPYLVIDDLLEDKLIWLSSDIDKTRFYTGTKQNMPYLLPVKKEYFRFFTKDDLKKKISIQLVDNKEVTVTLSIPLKNRKEEVKLTRKYIRNSNDGNNYPIIDCHRGQQTFNIGVFPFFRIKEEEQDNVKNCYDIMVGATSQLKDVKVNLYQFKAPESALKINYEGKRVDAEQANSVASSTRKDINTRHMRVDSTFDIIEFKVRDNEGKEAVGIALPEMTEIKRGSKQFVFAVDFGTTNTHIAWAEKQDVKNTLQGFSVNDDEAQVVFLMNPQQGTNIQFYDEARREFPPLKIFSKDSKDDTDYVKLPMRTAIYKIEQQVPTPELFCHLNIGFNYIKENKKEFAGNIYMTNIKWSETSFELFENYFKQLLWMMRNKSVLNGGNDSFEVLITYPQSMSSSQRSNIIDAWIQAQEDLGFGNKIDYKENFLVESWAPYARLRSKDVGVSDVFVNVDIGGGSTDIVYINPSKSGKCRTYSVNFAANDLWGVGIDRMHRSDKENGFIKVYLDNAKGDESKLIKGYKEVANDASDVISYIFASCPNFGRSISSHPVHSVIIIHFASIIYYLSLIIKSEDLKAPKIVSFTGMGSKYLDMIAGLYNNDAITNLVNTVFELNNLEKTKIESIVRVENPKEVTAEGALLTNDAINRKLEILQSKVYGVKDEDDDDFKGVDVKNNEVRRRTIDQVKDFIEVLNNEKFINAVKECGRDFNPEWLKIKALEDEQLESSYQLVENTVKDNDKINDALFFWPLKDTLYQAAMELSNRKETDEHDENV